MNSDAERLFHEGNAFLRARDHGRAEACFRRAVTMEPSLAEAHANLGWVVARAGETGLAEATTGAPSRSARRASRSPAGRS